MDGSAYLAEILHASGLCFTERGSLRDVLKEADPRRDVILLPWGSETAGIEAFLQAGGGVIAIRPVETIRALAGLKFIREDDDMSRLRLVQPVCHGARGEPLWTLGTVDVCEANPGPNVVGYLFKPFDLESEKTGIAEHEVGKGRLVVYTYDPVMCIVRLRQGYAERADFLPAGQDTPRSIHLHKPNPPHDTAWRPTADLHATTLCMLTRRLLGRHAPVPSLWHLPGGHPALVIYSGDEDWGTQEANDEQMKALESVGGGMSLYVIPDGTSITRKHIEEYTRRGHAISVHPNLTSERGKSRELQLAKAEEQILFFQKTFNWPVRTLRNHCTMWPGYVDLPRLYERLGVGMDANCMATLYGQSPDGGPYVNVDSAIPLRFVEENGKLIDVFQQATHVNDDVTCHPTVGYSQKYSTEQFDWFIQRIYDDAVRWFHGPVCVNVHPCNFILFSGIQSRMSMQRAHELGLWIWSIDRWHDFWRARSSWQMRGIEWNGSQLSFSMGGSACESLWLTLPVSAQGRTLKTVKLDGASVKFENVQRHGHTIAQAALPPKVTEIKVVAEYEAS